MLRFVSIRHLAVIEALDLSLDTGLTVLTGETGAGKSVLVEGIGLLLGGRASADMVRTGADTTIVQAIVSTPHGGDIIVRREVSAEGRSRAFLDDTLVTAGALKERMAVWVDLHGQHEHQTLQLPQTHLDLLDRVAGLTDARADVAAAHSTYVAARDALAALQLDARERAARIELLTFQLAEVDKVQPLEGEDDQLASTRQVLANADRVQRLSTEAFQALYEDEHAALEILSQVWRRLDELAALDPAVRPYASARDDVKAQLEDLAFFLRRYISAIDASPARLQEVEDRLAALDRLKRKYGPTLDEVRAHRERAREQLTILQQPESQLSTLQGAAHAAAEAFLRVARTLSAARRAAAPRLAARLRTELAELAMPAADVAFAFGDASAEGEWSATGVDQVELLLSANPGEAPRPLARVASGGELSRVMLAIKVIDAPDTLGRTIIFDEVDAGIGGRVADSVGARLRALSIGAQVLCVTHLPQVAAYADSHVHISKQVKAGRTLTSAQLLAGDARVEELARMMAGSTSAPLLEGARTLLEAKAKGEAGAKGESESAALRRKGKARGAKVSG